MLDRGIFGSGAAARVTEAVADSGMGVGAVNFLYSKRLTAGTGYRCWQTILGRSSDC